MNLGAEGGPQAESTGESGGGDISLDTSTKNKGKGKVPETNDMPR